MILDTLFEGFAEGAGLDILEAKKAALIIFIHNTADFIINQIFHYVFAANQPRGVLLTEHLLVNSDLLRKATALKKSGIIDDKLYKNLTKLNDMRVSIAHGKEKDSQRLNFKEKNILSGTAKLLEELDDLTVQELLKIVERVRRVRIYKDKWPEKPFIQGLYDKDRK